MSNGNGREKQQDSHIGVVNLDGKELKVMNSVTVLSIQVDKLEDGREVSRLISHEFMMTEHKAYLTGLLTWAITKVFKVIKPKYHRYLIRHLTDGINAVAKATKRAPNKVKIATENQFNRLRNKVKGGFGRK